ncbi:GGDEF domain-containing protein [Lelliottia sp. SL45]|uniref:GGDEF domain-containing protein n=1 Tax=Lelliottia sp. SL45 TaxID=2994665 RepID=UPI002272C5B6|nr:GGDEF domain-containing protein [Lelliottia sp. SL45]MCY1700812.1 GGDEF domain-containing protein [Lelliottia sp. SL45]
MLNAEARRGDTPEERPADRNALRNIIPLMTLGVLFLCTALTLCVTLWFQKQNVENYVMTKNALYATKLSEMAAWHFCRAGRLSDCGAMFKEETIEERYMLTCYRGTDSPLLAATRCFQLPLQEMKPAGNFDPRWLITPVYAGLGITLSDILDLRYDVDRERVFIIDDALMIVWSRHPWLAGFSLDANYNMFIHFNPAVSTTSFRATVKGHEYLVSHAQIGASRYHMVIAGTPGSVIDILLYASRNIIAGSLFLLLVFSVLIILIVRRLLFPLNQLAEATQKITLIDFYRVSTGYREIYYLWKAIYGYHLQVTSKINTLSGEASTDPLTRLFNRRGLTGAFDWRRGGSHWLMLADIDNFKSINDRLGHAAGDEVLIDVASILTRHSRLSDICCRFGGEEFVLFMPDTTEKEALNIARGICHAVENHDFKLAGRVTLSAGIAGMDGFDGDLDACIRYADEQLYRAKSQGKNQVCA